MYKFLLTICLAALSVLSAAQDKEFPKLDKLYQQGKYEKCIKAAVKISKDKKSAREPMPYLYKAMSYWQLSKLPEGSTELKRPMEQAVKAMLAFRRKDKKQLLTDRSAEFLAQLRTDALAKAKAYQKENNCTKSIRLLEDIITLYQDASAMYLKSQCLLKAKETAKEGQLALSQAVHTVMRQPQSAALNPEVGAGFAQLGPMYYEKEEDSSWYIMEQGMKLYPAETSIQETYTSQLINNMVLEKDWYTAEQVQELEHRADVVLKLNPSEKRLIALKSWLCINQIGNMLEQGRTDDALVVYGRMPGSEAEKSAQVNAFVQTLMLSDKFTPAGKQRLLVFVKRMNKVGSDQDWLAWSKQWTDSLLVSPGDKVKPWIAAAALGFTDTKHIALLKAYVDKQLLAKAQQADSTLPGLWQVRQYMQSADQPAAIKQELVKRYRETLSALQQNFDYSTFATVCKAARRDFPADTEILRMKRRMAEADYQVNFLGTDIRTDSLKWNGNMATCAAGNISKRSQQLFLERLNYFRRQAGVYDSVLLDSALNVRSQAAALMMLANNSLNHEPPKNWKCYTTAGADGAGGANLSLGENATAALYSQMMDEGADNWAAGHRRWILNPYQTLFGHGSTSGSMALYVFGRVGKTPARKTIEPLPADEAICWPPADFAPARLVSSRWTISVDEADFSKARVQMTVNGKAVAVKPEKISEDSYGLNTLVWLVPKAQELAGKTCRVTVSGVKLSSGKVNTYTYTVNVLKL